MSILFCDDCGAFIDTDDFPDRYMGYRTNEKCQLWLCEDCEHWLLGDPDQEEDAA